jgi:hypothetical protein
VHFPLELEATRPAAGLSLGGLRVAFPESLASKIGRVKKGFVGLEEEDGVLQAQRLVGFEGPDELSVREILREEGLFPVKIVD